MSVADDKRELLKLKQGLIEESEIIGGEKPVVEKPKGKAAVANFFYHYKAHIIVIAFFAAVAGFLVFWQIRTPKGDIRILTIASNTETSSVLYLRMKEIEEAVEAFTPDFDESGYIHAENYFIDITEEGVNPDVYYANKIKMFAEIADGKAQIFICNAEVFEIIAGDENIENYFLDLSGLYPDEPEISGCFYKFKGSPLAYEANILVSCPDDLYIALRSGELGITASTDKAEEYRRQALTVFDNIVSGNKADEDVMRK